MRLDPLDRATAHAVMSGDLGGREAAPGWPHEDTTPGLSFVDHGGEAFLVIDDDGRVAGECGTKAPPDAEGMVEIGYGLGTGSRGRGLGAALVAALVARLRAEPGIHRIEAEVHAHNIPSQRVIERQGLVPVGDPHGGYVRYRLELGGSRA